MSDQAPKRIYLQSYNSDCYYDNTWCIDQINDDDIEYILQSEYDKLHAENKKIKYTLSELFEACMCADAEGELSERINGEILDAAMEALKGGE